MFPRSYLHRLFVVVQYLLVTVQSTLYVFASVSQEWVCFFTDRHVFPGCGISLTIYCTSLSLFCGSMLTSLLVSSPIAPHNHLPGVRVVLRTRLVADSYASITMGGARQFAVSIMYYLPSEPISRISVSSLTRSRRLDTYFHIQY
jgi:hypothetical protein